MTLTDGLMKLRSDAMRSTSPGWSAPCLVRVIDSHRVGLRGQIGDPENAALDAIGTLMALAGELERRVAELSSVRPPSQFIVPKRVG